MTTSATVFDNNIAQWVKEQSLPWQKLKYKLVQANLAKHLSTERGRILDAGGGNGFESIPFAEQGHRIDIVDYSREMLAEAVRQATIASVQEQVAVHCADVGDIPSLFPDTPFDLVLCHNVLQYVEDVPGLLKSLTTVLKAGGVTSVVSINRYSIPYRTAFPRGSLNEALAQLNTRSMKGMVFDTILINYSAEEISEMLESAGCVVEKDYGIRCLCDYWGDNELKSDPAIIEQLERLEFALTDKHPYKLLARYFQVVARKA